MLRKSFGRLGSIGLVLLLLCSGCRSVQTGDSPSTTSVSPVESPPATPSTAPPADGSPVATPEWEVSAAPDLPKFQLSEPLIEGETVVTGKGPAGVPILVVDVSYMTVIGEGRVDEEGEFSIDVEPPLAEYSMIGIMFDETKDSPYTEDELPCEERCRDQPLVGLLFDRARVVKP